MSKMRRLEKEAHDEHGDKPAMTPFDGSLHLSPKGRFLDDAGGDRPP